MGADIKFNFPFCINFNASVENLKLFREGNFNVKHYKNKGPTEISFIRQEALYKRECYNKVLP